MLRQIKIFNFLIFSLRVKFFKSKGYIFISNIRNTIKTQNRYALICKNLFFCYIIIIFTKIHNLPSHNS